MASAARRQGMAFGLWRSGSGIGLGVLSVGMGAPGEPAVVI
jgi:hypothetical protein